MTAITFLGGAGTVTGSKYLIEAAGRRILLDCGLFQGYKQLRLRDWKPLPVPPAGIDAVVLSHAHLDHSGYIPLLVRNGFTGRVFATEATAALCGILLPDSGHLMEREAEFANRKGFSKHKPALPLYTLRDARAALERFHPVPFHAVHDLGGGVSFRFLRAGHILGAAIVELTVGERRLVFSGDLGRYGAPTMFDPETVTRADWLMVESTYGNRRHDPDDPEDALVNVIARTAGRGGTLIIPSFAVGRTQSLLYHLHRLKREKRIPDVPVFLDSPMAQDASDIFCTHHADHPLSAAEARAACRVARYVQSVEESKTLDANHLPRIIIAASGMATGGRVVHHLKALAGNPRNTVLFAGFQAGGTRGTAMLAGAREIKIHGEYVPVRAEVDSLDMLSAHADCDELMRWLGGLETAPERCFIVHGEPDAAEALRRAVEERLGWNVDIPEHRERTEL
jgi:metallo-beta-lactamase family protein